VEVLRGGSGVVFAPPVRVFRRVRPGSRRAVSRYLAAAT
jgi:hypothetical protein